MDYAKLTAPCGKYCFNCPLFMGEDNRENRENFLRRNNIPEDKFQCQGCRPNNGYCPGLEILGIDGHCKMYACIQAKGVEFCFECAEFPCIRLQPVADRAERVPHALKIFNLCMIQKIGVEEWATNHSRKIFNQFYTTKLNELM